MTYIYVVGTERVNEPTLRAARGGNEVDDIMIHLLISKLPFFCPYAMVLFNFSVGPHVSEPTIRAPRGGNED